MEDDNKARQIEDIPDEQELTSRRDFLQSLKKWSQAVIGGVVLGSLLPGSEAGDGGKDGIGEVPSRASGTTSRA
jgi:hypothetical protein